MSALPREMAAAKVMLDEVHDDLPVSSTDHNTYILGSIKEHNVVIACLPSGDYGLVSANTVAMQLLSSFRSIRFGLMVGIGGGVPNSAADIRLGDVVVSKPTGIYGGVVQYDYGKALSGQFQRIGMLNRPPQILLTALSKLQTNHIIGGSKIADFLAEVGQKIPQQASGFARPAQEDHLYLSDYHHVNSESMTCDACDPTQIVSRASRGHDEPVIHYGLIASANKLVRDSKLRDRLGRELGVYCVEMEAAGLSNNFPCLVVRGICDYADSHKNKIWQQYAAVVAAAYAKELLLCTSVRHIDQVQTVRDSLSKASDFQVPFNLTGVPAVENFLGRHEELERLWHYLQPEKNKKKRSRKVAILHGLGGIGKTQLAIRFAREHKDHFTAIFWLAGRNRETLLQSLSSVLSQLPSQSGNSAAKNEGEAEQNAKQVLKWLALPDNSQWLLILDNVDQYSPGTHDGYDIEKFFPTADHGSILITSRLQSLTELGRPFPVQGFNFEDAISLLWQRLTDGDVMNLINRLGGLPLAITIAGAFMRETGTNVSEYLQHYQSSWHDLQLHANPGRHYPHGNVLQTWSVSYDKIRKQDPDIAELLLFLAHFDNRDIWYKLLKNGTRSSNQPKWFAEVLSDSLVFKKRIKILIEFSLLNVNEQGGSYMMHPVVQDWCLDVASIEDKARNRRWDELALVSVGYTVPARFEAPYWELRRRLLIHADYVRRAWINDCLTDDAAIWDAIHRIGMLYYDQGKSKKAEAMYRRALAGYAKALGADCIPILDMINDTGALYLNLEKLKEVEMMSRRGLAGYGKAPGPYHIAVLDLVNNLGVLYSGKGNLSEAETMYQWALAGYEKALGPDHNSTLVTVTNLGHLYRDQKKWMEAKKLYQRALAVYKKTLGPNHTSTLNVVDNIGVLYRDYGKLDEAETMLQQALAGYKRALGFDHTHTLNTFYNLGILYKDQGKLEEAKILYQQALAGYEKVLGADHVFTLKIVSRIGDICIDQRKPKEAETLYQRALAGYEATLGPNDYRTMEVAEALKMLGSKRGRKHRRALL
ncbi:Disease resistance protein [Penicillium occitanis (nom. inval.)]|nr:Disease resistance protein [Penicillium occitanis (nom. inval.)]PCH01371.1 hypothetical protein PENOC_048570 [Penicillium occitanis (nom. inval.)]